MSKRTKSKPTYDIKILGWILGFAGKYKLYFTLSFLLMTATAAFEIAVPYLIKVAVDNYVYPTWSMAEVGTDRRLFSEISPSAIVMISDTALLVDFSRLSRSEKDKIARAKIPFSQTKYVVVYPEEFKGEQKQKILDLVKSKPEIFEQVNGAVFAPHFDIQKLSKNEISVIRSGQIRKLKTLSIYILISITGIFVFTSAFTYALHYSGHRIMHDIRRHAFSHILSLPQVYFDRNPVGRITTRVTNDINAINDMYTSVLIHFIKDVIIIVGILVMMFAMDAGLALIIVGLTIFLIFVVSIFRTKLRAVYRDIRSTISRLNTFVAESVRGIVLIKLYGKEERNFERFWKVNRENYRANIRQLWVYVIFRPSIEYVSIAATGIILWYGAIRVSDLDLSLGALLAFLYYVRMIFKPIQELSEKYNIFQSAVAASENLYELLAERPEQGGPLAPIECQGSLEFQGVWFSYNEKEWVLEDVSFKVMPGQTVALVGITGAGKSTIVNLILKFYKPQKGRILFNGIDVEQLSNQYLRQNVTAIFQDLFLFEKDVSDRREQSVVSTKMPLELSSGEAQARSIEKALRKNSRFLIMDEATSHLDAETEKTVQKIMEKNSGIQTRLIITHRLTTLKDVHSVIVINRGKVVEQGTHQKLLQNQGPYYALYDFLKKTGDYSVASNNA